MFNEYKSITDFILAFSTEKLCTEYLETVRWENGISCSHCESTNFHSYKDSGKYRCYTCGNNFNVKTGTIFHGTRLSLPKWFLAIYLLTTNRKGISSVQLAEQLGVTQKTAWFLAHRIREAYMQGSQELSSPVEIDETYIGEKEKNKHFNKKSRDVNGKYVDNKQAVVGIVSRSTGEIQAFTVNHVNSEMVNSQIVPRIESDAEIYTDDAHVYKDLDLQGFVHSSVCHSAHQYVMGNTHTNTIEGFWSILKRGYIGIYHYMSFKHLQRYINEFCFRYMYSEIGAGTKLFSTIIGCEKRLTYKELING